MNTNGKLFFEMFDYRRYTGNVNCLLYPVFLNILGSKDWTWIRQHFGLCIVEGLIPSCIDETFNSDDCTVDACSLNSMIWVE